MPVSRRVREGRSLAKWLSDNLAVPFQIQERDRGCYQVKVDAYALKTRLQLMQAEKKNLARWCTVIAAVLGFGIGYLL